MLGEKILPTSNNGLRLQAFGAGGHRFSHRQYWLQIVFENKARSMADEDQALKLHLSRKRRSKLLVTFEDSSIKNI